MGLFDFLKPQPSKQERLAKLVQELRAVSPVIIPGGKADIEAWGRRVHGAVDGRLTMEECQFIFGSVTFLFALPGDKSENRMVDSILGRANGKISRDDARRIFRVLCAYQEARQPQPKGQPPSSST
jgi:hypothetical protein